MVIATLLNIFRAQELDQRTTTTYLVGGGDPFLVIFLHLHNSEPVKLQFPPCLT